jgi:hypothetical protein
VRFDIDRSAATVRALGLLTCLCITSGPVHADSETVSNLSPRVLFTVSGGYWENIPAAGAAGDATASDDGEDGSTNVGDDDAAASEGSEATTPGRGYYRAVAYRSQDNTSRLYLQQIALTDTGPEILDTTEIEAVTQADVYITDIRPENSTGVSATAGFTAFIFLKTAPDAAEPETWELFVDEFGDVTIDGATN